MGKDDLVVIPMGKKEYILNELVGEGSFGTVYRGRRRYSSQTVAIKFITKHSRTEDELHNLRQEIEILRKLKHDNIIEMLDSYESPHEFWIVTEFAQGALSEVVRDDKCLPEAEVQAIAKQLVKALHYLHSNRIIHRDMKPDNILFGEGSVVKICDFGLARAMPANTVVLRSVKGTPLYMAPEVLREQPYNNTADLWSLGVILFELFVGQPPFYADTVLTLIRRILKDPVKYPENMSSDFKSFLEGLLHKVPENRLNWPALLEHPFVKESPDELDARVEFPGRILRSLDHIELSDVARPIAMIAKMVRHRPLAVQLLKEGLLDPNRVRRLLAGSNTRESVLDFLMIVSDLARMSQDFYEHIGKADLLEFLKNFLNNEDADIRAKACSAIGNMCRHNPYFYGALVGNAAFYNDTLYGVLSRTIPQLTKLLLSAEDTKTKSNAAWALSNLVRHSSLLCEEIVSHGAMQALLKLVSDSSTIALSPKKGDAIKESPLKIVLVALFKMCDHAICKQFVRSSEFFPQINQLKQSPDADIAKCATDIISKVRQT